MNKRDFIKGINQTKRSIIKNSKYGSGVCCSLTDVFGVTNYPIELEGVVDIGIIYKGRLVRLRSVKDLFDQLFYPKNNKGINGNEAFFLGKHTEENLEKYRLPAIELFKEICISEKWYLHFDSPFR